MTRHGVALLLAVAIAATISAIVALLLMLLWNAAVPPLWPAAPRATFWPTWALLLLVQIVIRILRHPK